MKKYKVAFATGSRADYGIVRNYIAKLNADPTVDFSILTTGALLASEFGSAVEIIEQDGFHIEYKDVIPQKMNSLHDTCHIMAQTLDDFSLFFSKHNYDLLIILGDRYEIYSVSIAAAMHRVPIIHLHGGELTVANYDEFIRHSITKMATWHITSTEEYRQRVIQLGEQPKNVYYLGALGAENCLNINMKNVPKDFHDIHNSFVVLFHPETLNDVSPIEQVEVVLRSIEPFTQKYDFIFIGSNADTHADLITSKVKDFCNNHEKCSFYSNLHPDCYHYIVKKSIALIGNSSSGIIEVPSLGSYTVNIGDRQTGRVKSSSILDVCCNVEAITNAINYTITHKNDPIEDTPYYKKNSAELYYKTTMDILRNEKPQYKVFYDIKNNTL